MEPRSVGRRWRQARAAARSATACVVALVSTVGCGPSVPLPLHRRDAFDGPVRIVVHAGAESTELVGRLTFIRGRELRFAPADGGPVLEQTPDGARLSVDGELRPLDPTAERRLLVLMTALLSAPRDAAELTPLDGDEPGYRIAQPERSIEVRFGAGGR